MGFEQATIKVEQEKEFGELKGAIARIFAPEQVEKVPQALGEKRRPHP